MSQRNILSNARLEWIGTGKIDCADRLFALEWPVERQIDPLVESVKKAGLLDPLWVIGKGRGQYRLVDGFRRLVAARGAHLAEVPALVLESTVDTLELYKARLARPSRMLSAVEASRVIERLGAEFDMSDKQLAEVFLPVLGLGSSIKILAETRRLDRLEDPVARFCAVSGVGLREATLWAQFPGEGQQAVLELVLALKPGRNLLRSYLQLLSEISLRESLPVQDILADRRIRDIVLDPQKSRSGGREIVHGILRRRRNPLMEKIEEDFHSVRKALELPEEVSLEPPPFFEGHRIKVAFEIGSRKELEKKALGLVQASRKPKASRLFSALGAPPEKKRTEK